MRNSTNDDSSTDRRKKRRRDCGEGEGDTKQKTLEGERISIPRFHSHELVPQFAGDGMSCGGGELFLLQELLQLLRRLVTFEKKAAVTVPNRFPTEHTHEGSLDFISGVSVTFKVDPIEELREGRSSHHQGSEEERERQCEERERGDRERAFGCLEWRKIRKIHPSYETSRKMTGTHHRPRGALTPDDFYYIRIGKKKKKKNRRGSVPPGGADPWRFCYNKNNEGSAPPR